MLAVDDGLGATPVKRLAWVLTSDESHDNSSPDPNHRLHKLYTAILDRNFLDATPNTLSSLKSVLGLVICAKEPVPLRVLATLSLANETPTEDDLYECQYMLRSLGSLISGVHDLDTVVKPLHTSFNRYLLNGDQSGKYSIDVTESRSRITRECFEIMQQGLRFNICACPTSLQRNSDLENLASTTSANISSTLSYSCRHWPQHVFEVHNETSKNIESPLLRFFRDHFLHWLEVMSVLGISPYTALMRLSHPVSRFYS